MSKIFITCPSCHKSLCFNEVQGWQSMLVQCPACQFKATASVYLAGNAAKGGQGSDDEATQVAFDEGGGTPCIDTGCLRIKETGQRFALKEGQNVIGRKTSCPQADIALAADPYMSRRHARIDVVAGANGYEHHLVEVGSKNILFLNGQPLQRGDIIVLSFGDTLRLGHTDVVFEETEP